jgi:galactokinase
MIATSRKQALIDKHILCFGQSPTHLVQTPGRIELFGGYTAFHGGLTLSMAIDQYLYASFSENSLRSIRIFSSGYPAMTFSLDQGTFIDDVASLSAQVVKQLFDVCLQKGSHFSNGIDIFIQSDFSKFASLASSTAFALTILEIMLKVAPTLSPMSLHQKASILAAVERQDQAMLSKVIDAYPLYQGGILMVDSHHQQKPIYQRLTRVFQDYRFLLIHVPAQVMQPRLLTNHIKDLMGIIAQHYHQTTLSQVDMLDFQHDGKDLIRMYGQKAVNNVKFFHQENQRVKMAFLSLEKDDESLLFSLTQQSQTDQENLLDNVLIPGQSEQKLANTLNWLSRHTKTSHYRLQGLGFQGPILMVIPKATYKETHRQLKQQFSDDAIREIRNVNKGYHINNL